jgi:hypothetical protein
MSDLKFTCPSCGQHIRCDVDYAGERIPCPSCASVVRVPVDAPVVTPAPVPAAIPPAPQAPGMAVVPTLEDNFLEKSGASMPSSPPMTEREKQLAAARAEHPVVPTPIVKPRLSYILSGGQAPVQEENESATQTPQNHHPDSPPDTKSLSE